MSDEVLATDPASGYDPGSWLLFNNVFQSLLSFPKGGTTREPEAAETCAFEDSDSKVYTCTLRDGLKFSNGDASPRRTSSSPSTRMLKINDANGPAVMFPIAEQSRPRTTKTVVFHLKTPDATFPSKIASGAGSIVDHARVPGGQAAQGQQGGRLRPLQAGLLRRREGRLLGQRPATRAPPRPRTPA